MFKKANKNKKWKEESKLYLKELQTFLDQAENIQDEILKRNIIYQMLRCDSVLTKLAENRFIDYYKMGYKKAKSE